VSKVTRLKDDEVPNPKPVVMVTIPHSSKIFDTTLFDSFGDWNDKGERVAYTRSKNNPQLKQRIANMTPQRAVVITIDFRWNMAYTTQEYGPERTRKFLEACDDQYRKNVKPEKRYLDIAGFLQGCGFFAEAEKEFVNITRNFPDAKEAKDAAEALVKLRKD